MYKYNKFNTELEKAFEQVYNEMEVENNVKKEPITNKIILGVGIALVAIFFIIGKVNANAARPYNYKSVKTEVINNTNLSIVKTLDNFNIIQQGHAQTYSLWTVTFDAPVQGWYSIEYTEIGKNQVGQEIGLIKQYNVFCDAGHNVLNNVIATIYAWERGGFVFTEEIGIKANCVKLYIFE